MKALGEELHGDGIVLWRSRLSDELHNDEGQGNPLLWWAVDTKTEDRDFIACGTKTKREALSLVEEYRRAK